MVTNIFRAMKDSEIKTLPEFRAGAWVYVEDPVEDEIHRLADELKLEAGHLKDALDPNEVPRLEVEDNDIYIYTRVPFYHKDQYLTLPVLFVMGEGFLMTVASRRLPFLDKFMNGKREFFTTQKVKLFLLLFSEINILFQNSINQISRMVRAKTVNMEKISNNDILQFVRLEEALNDFLQVLTPTNSILNKIIAGRIIPLFEYDEDLIEDLSLSTGQLIENCRSSLRHIVNSRDAYSTIMSNNLNRVIKLLTAMTIILNIPMIITSFYGMNVNLPFSGGGLAFIYIIIMTLGISGLVVYLFNRNRWL